MQSVLTMSIPSPLASLNLIDMSSSEAGPSTPAHRSEVRAALLETPAPPSSQEPLTAPNAPPPQPAAKNLPLSTPISSLTPSVKPDVAEFDPFATPTTPSALRPTTPDASPAFNFPGFLKDLRLKSADPVARYLKSTFTPQLVPSQPITTDDLERDAVFAQRVRLFGWVRERHLDVPESEASQGFLGFAEQVIFGKAARENTLMTGLIRQTSGAEATSADAFIPILIFVVLQANPANMLSNVDNITREEFERNVEAAIQELPTSPSAASPRRALPSDMSPFAAETSGEEPARPLSLSTSFPALDNTRRFFQRTGNTVQEAVSKPINAIGKILENMQQPESDDGSDDDGGSSAKRVPRQRAVTPDSPSRGLSHFGLLQGESQPGSAP
ncbi:hypothetical protein P7C73_g262, partial [Tremellales sp. Uapishka_1]